jgi:hypothetical protein
MNVILDANIYISDYWMQSQDFRFLKDYINKTKSSLLLPSVVLEEVKGIFKNQLIDNAQKLQSILSQLSRFRIALISNEEIQKSIETANEKFITEIEFYFTQHHAKVIPLSVSATNEAINRSIYRIPPCRQTGEGLRDALIWLQILEYLQGDKQQQLAAFICRDKHDFVQNNGRELVSKLLEDLKERNIKLEYYPDLESFLRKHAKPIEHINKEWLKERINVSQVNQLILHHLNPPQSSNIRNVFDIESSDYEENYKIIGDIVDIQVIDLNIDDFIVWEFDENNIELRIDYFATIEGTAECELVEFEKSPFIDKDVSFSEYIETEVLAEVYVSVKASIINGLPQIEHIENIEKA